MRRTKAGAGTSLREPPRRGGRRVSEATVVSRDGTMIAYRTLGHGPPVVVIPGALARASDFDGFANALADRCTVHTVDRRGRGNSGPKGVEYGIAKEVEDVRAVQERTGASLVFGHSFGGFVALECALELPSFERIAVYEPGVSIHQSLRMDWAPQCTRELGEGRALDAFVTFVRGINPETSGKAPRWLLKLILPIAMGKAELAEKYELLAGSISEHAEAARLNDSAERYREIAAAVLLMSGKDIDRTGTGRATALLAHVLQRAELASFPKLDHFGPEKDPERVAERALAFFFPGD
jgi:pimeloyl-ACP methyl ester carboxylesterase